MFAADAPTYTIDLDGAEEQRWAEVISRERALAQLLLQEAEAEFKRVPELLRWIFAGVYKVLGGLYQREIGAWAEGVGATV